MKPMNPEIKALWLEALRSGEYVQGTGALHMETPSGEIRYCCLGVLCDLAEKAGIVKRKMRTDRNPFGERVFRYSASPEHFDASTTGLPDCVETWSGVPRSGEYGDESNSLASLNDGGMSFTDIADIIEEHF